MFDFKMFFGGLNIFVEVSKFKHFSGEMEVGFNAFDCEYCEKGEFLSSVELSTEFLHKKIEGGVSLYAAIKNEINLMIGAK